MRGTLAVEGRPARVGTASLRRAAQLRALAGTAAADGADGFEVVEIRGNVDTRLSYVERGDLDGVILARAGLARLGRLDAATEVLDPLQMLPAPGQGALAVECRDPQSWGPAADVLSVLAVLDDPDTRAAVTAERSLLAALEAGCSAPVGAFGEAVEGEQEMELYLRAVVLATDGSASVRLSTTGPIGDAEMLGRKLAAEMLAEGADGLMREERS